MQKITVINKPLRKGLRKKVRHYVVDKNEYVSVTTPLSLLSFQYIDLWKLRVGATKAGIIGKKAGNYGNKMHDYFEKVCQNKKFKVKKKYQKDLKAFKKWFDENVEEVIATEKIVYSHKYKLAGRYDFLGRIKGYKGICIVDWKGLDKNIDIPTPKGFKTMAELKEGDIVFGGDGTPCKILHKSKTHIRPCYKISFDDKTSVVCDNVHLWKLIDGSVVPVTKLKIGNKIPVSMASYEKKELLIDPYILGIWLADGKHTSGEIHNEDDFIWKEIVRRGGIIGHNYSKKANNSKCRVHTVKGLRKNLKKLNVYANKHIPNIYLYSSFKQRLQLLQGLMDGDGNVNSTRKQAVFTSCNKILSTQVKQLLASLGQRANQASITKQGFGLNVKVYPLAFRPQNLNPFLLPRKANKIKESWGRGNSWFRRIINIEQVTSRPTQCIEVDSSDHTYLCTKDYIPTHNTGRLKPEHFLQLAAYRVLTAETDNAPIQNIKHRLVVGVRDGKVKMLPSNPKAPKSDKTIDSDWDIYKAILKVWRWKNKI